MSEVFQASETTIKVAQALGFLLSKDENHKMNRVKLIKLLWAADRLHLRKYGRTVSGTKYYAMAHGPVSSLALDIAQMNSEFALSNNDTRYLEEYFVSDNKNTAFSKDPGTDYLSDTDKAVLTEAWDKFGSLEPFELADEISHKYPEWSKYKEYFEAGNSSRQDIDLADFFKNPPDKDLYFEENGTQLSAAKEIFEEEQRVGALLRGE